ncbi:MAG TPA: VIT1/CCC1 transporter family protein [Rhabdochlamydiaceae bacterium]|nr:VIT1/CCC1 transporter family protein [Rhabdochlamydiaceae bacterium]
MDHFQGKTVPEHLKEARERGAFAKAEVHGTEIPGHLAALSDSCKDSAIALLILWALLSQSSLSHSASFLILGAFSLGWLIWKTGRSALLGWSRLERLHRVIEEERFEIEHHRQQERSELTELYRAKGFSGKLLTDAVDVLMADDNRLLTIMLEEEFGLSLESYEHPLKQSFGAFAGTLLCSLLLLLTFYFLPGFALPCAALFIVSLSSAIAAKLEGNNPLPAFIWNLSVALSAGSGVYFLSKLAFSL